MSLQYDDAAGLKIGNAGLQIAPAISAPPVSNWILAAGSWDDAGVWDDAAVWKDS